MAKKALQYNLEYTLVNDATTKTITVNDIDSAAGVANAATFGTNLTGYMNGDYSIDTITLIETKRTPIE